MAAASCSSPTMLAATCPRSMAISGFPTTEFDRHIAYDIGVEMVTRKLAALTGAPAVLAGFSRLLIDPNRGEDDPTLIRQLYDGTVVPANYPMAPEERERRLDRFYRPYHDAVGAMIASVAASFRQGARSSSRCTPSRPSCRATSALACRRSLGSGRPRRAAAHRHVGRRPASRRRRQRAL